jgi:hypothetical protein
MRSAIEERIVKPVEGHMRPPRADGLKVANIPRVSRPLSSGRGSPTWDEIGTLTAAPWFFRARPWEEKLGKYEEPMRQHYVSPPLPFDFAPSWKAAWDDGQLYLLIKVRDDVHKQGQLPPAMWKEDCVQIALIPRRQDFAYDLHSWDYIWGGYRGGEVEFGVALRNGGTDVHMWQKPDLGEAIDTASLIKAVASRRNEYTMYEVAVDWKLLQGFTPGPERSFGISLVVNDVDNVARISAEYGGGVTHAKRPSECAALRLVISAAD